MDEDNLSEDDVAGEPEVLGEHVESLHEAISQIQTPGAGRSGAIARLLLHAGVIKASPVGKYKST